MQKEEGQPRNATAKPPQSHLEAGRRGRGPMAAGKLNFLSFAANAIILLAPESRHSGGL
jgi:hypothetical protein